MPRALALARRCVAGVSPLSGLSPELRGEADQAMPLGETRAVVANSLLVSRGLPRHDDGALRVSDVSAKWGRRLVKTNWFRRASSELICMGLSAP